MFETYGYEGDKFKKYVDLELKKANDFFCEAGKAREINVNSPTSKKSAEYNRKTRKSGENYIHILEKEDSFIFAKSTLPTYDEDKVLYAAEFFKSGGLKESFSKEASGEHHSLDGLASLSLDEEGKVLQAYFIIHGETIRSISEFEVKVAAEKDPKLSTTRAVSQMTGNILMNSELSIEK